MNNKDIEWKRKKLKEQRQALESGQWNALRQLLPNEIIEKACEECQYYFRARLLTPLVVIFHMIGAGISREGSFQSAWHLSGQSGRSGSLAKGRRRLPLNVWKQLNKWMLDEIEQEHSGEYRWRGRRMVGVDGTCFSMSDEPPLVAHFGQGGGEQGKSRFPLARMTLAFDLGTLVTLDHEAGHYRTGETELFGPILKRLKPGDVVVADRHFAGANLYVRYQQADIDFITRAHGALRVEELEVVEEFSHGDRLVKQKISRDHRRSRPDLPEWIVVRMILTRSKTQGKQETFWIATSLLDPKAYPAHEIGQQLKKRWKVEGLIEELKVWLGADVLRSQSVQGIHKELYARLMGLNLIHWLILKAAKQHKQKSERLSVAAALRLSVSYSLKMSAAPAWRLWSLYEEMLEHIARSTVRYRPNRLEPRMLKREHKRWPGLKISRKEWKAMHMEAA